MKLGGPSADALAAPPQDDELLDVGTFRGTRHGMTDSSIQRQESHRCPTPHPTLSYVLTGA
jgi:hypothetical protein